MWLQKKICFAVVARTEITRFLLRNNEPQNISFESVAKGQHQMGWVYY
jgi:hypothetical protein